MNRIVCVGNRYVRGDDLGPRVYDQLMMRALPDHVQVIDGGVAGLNLLTFFDGCERLVFVDCLSLGDTSDKVRVLEGDDLFTGEVAYGHAAGLGYVLQADRAIRADGAPHVFVVGTGSNATERAIAAVTELCLQIAQAPL